MAYGINIVNDSGYVQIDENYSNYSLIASGTAASGTRIYYPSGYSANNAIFMMRGAYGAKIYKYGRDLTYTEIRGATFEYKIYGKTTDASQSTSGFGLKVFNSAGACTFNSLDSTLRIQGSMIVGQDISLPYTIPSPGYHPFILADPIKPIGRRAVSQNESVLLSPTCTFNSNNSLYLVTEGIESMGIPVSSLWANNRSIIIGR